MKKIITLLLIVFISINNTFAYNNYVLTDEDIKTTEALVEAIENIIDDKGDAYRDLLVDKIDEILDKNSVSDQVATILEEVYGEITYYTEDDFIDILENQDIYNGSEKINNENNGEKQHFSNKEKLENSNYEIDDEEMNSSYNSVSSTDISSNYNLENIEVSDVISNWLSRNNEVRKDIGVDDYTYNYTLESSALSWSKQALEAGEISHQRYEDSYYYDYTEITERFSKEGVVCENIDGITHTENIWWGAYSCSDGECTEELDISVRNAFNTYMAEEGTDSDAHYRSLVQEYFNYIGVGIQIDTISDTYYEYYLTIHYCTNLK